MTVSTSVSSPETFRRMWEFYLAYPEAGFHSGYPGVSQLEMTREPVWS
jgi:cyclopropane-fatty-acyl-phospholipid synthase